MDSPPGTLAQALANAQARGVARLDAQMLLLHTLGRPVQDRAWLIAHDTDTLPNEAAGRFEALLGAVIQHRHARAALSSLL